MIVVADGRRIFSTAVFYIPIPEHSMKRAVPGRRVYEEFTEWTSGPAVWNHSVLGGFHERLGQAAR